ncbi:hypothetical protein [Stutzerimonas zhaodongensis]|uniref:hypothetical protein n=1 Tax=Stutzerimonas TaxID=2901164 RepID=UPI003890F19C
MPLDYPVASESGSMCLKELSIHKERSFGQIPINDITPRTLLSITTTICQE